MPEKPEPETIEEVSAVVDNFYESVKDKRTYYEANWFLNLSYYIGKQWSDYRHSLKRVQEVAGPSWRVRLVVNLILPFVRITEAKLLRNEPLLRVLPTSINNEESIKRSKTADKVLLSLSQSLDLSKVYHRTYLGAIIFGDNILKPYWNANAGQEYEDFETQTEDNGHPLIEKNDGIDVQRKDSNGQPLFIRQDSNGDMKFTFKRGEIELDEIACIDFYPDQGAEKWEDMRRCLQVKMMDVDEIYEKFNTKVSPDENIEVISFGQEIQTLVGSTNQGMYSHSAMVKEYWEAPTKLYPRGRHIITANKIVLLNSEIPPEYLGFTPPFPYIQFGMIDVPKRLWHKSPVEDMRPIARTFNGVVSKMIEYINTMAAPKVLIPEGAGLPENVFTSEPNQQVTFTAGPWGKPEYMQLNPITPSMFEVLPVLQAGLNEVSGVHEVSRGGTPKGVRSGQAIAQLQEMDETQLEPVLDDMKVQLEKLGKMLLRLVRQHYSEPRTLKIIGKDSVEYVENFIGKDIEDCEDITVELGSSLPNNRIAREQIVIQRFGQGLYTREQALKALEIDGDEILDKERLDESKAKIENIQMSQATAINIDIFDDHLVHLREHSNDMKGPAYHLEVEQIKKLKLMHYKAHIEALKTSGLPPEEQVKMAPPPGKQGKKK